MLEANRPRERWEEHSGSVRPAEYAPAAPGKVVPGKIFAEEGEQA
jgi:hypothetical protein